MSSKDDWAPLPTGQSKGQQGGAARESAPVVRSKKAAADGGRSRPRSSQPNPFAEMMLAQLKDKLSATEGKDSVARELTKAARRFDRKKLASSPEFASTSGQVQSELRGLEDLPLDLAYEIGRDPREDEPSFLALPPEEQQRLRGLWEAERKRLTLQPREFRRVQLHLILSALAVYLVAALLLVPFEGVHVVPGMLVSGLLTGFAWLPLRRTRFSFALAGALVFVLGKVCGSAMIGHGFEEFADESMTMLLTAIIVTFGCGLVGFDCEMRLSGGFKQG